MSYSIYVGGLPYKTNDEELSELFAKYGQVTRAKVVMDRESGRSRGFGFVEMENDDEGAKAVADLNGSDFGGRKLTVSKALEDRKSN